MTFSESPGWQTLHYVIGEHQLDDETLVEVEGPEIQIKFFTLVSSHSNDLEVLMRMSSVSPREGPRANVGTLQTPSTFAHLLGHYFSSNLPHIPQYLEHCNSVSNTETPICLKL